jgi:hypothetical protein
MDGSVVVVGTGEQCGRLADLKSDARHVTRRRLAQAPSVIQSPDVSSPVHTPSILCLDHVGCSESLVVLCLTGLTAAGPRGSLPDSPVTGVDEG